jgi:hypothetical protein
MDELKRCNAKSKQSGERCKNAVIEGKRVCRIHGGMSPGGPIKHGRYSVTRRAVLRDKIEEFRNDPQAGDLRDELAVLRALMEDYLNRFDDNRNLTGADIMLVYSMVDNIGKLVERIAKILSLTALTQAELQLLQVTLIDAIKEFIPEPERQRAFVSRIGTTFGGRVGASMGSLPRTIGIGVTE